MIRMSVTALALTFSITALAAQDPLTVLPDSYTKQFENAWVRVVRVRYAPHAKLPAHAHNALPAAYVYLNDGGPVLFRHIGASYGAATRPATKAGSFRVFRGIDEIHEVENTSELPSDFLRVEFKTDPKDVRTLKGRYFRPGAPHGQNSCSSKTIKCVSRTWSARQSLDPAFRCDIRAFAADRLPGGATA